MPRVRPSKSQPPCYYPQVGLFEFSESCDLSQSVHDEDLVFLFVSRDDTGHFNCARQESTICYRSSEGVFYEALFYHRGSSINGLARDREYTSRVPSSAS